MRTGARGPGDGGGAAPDRQPARRPRLGGLLGTGRGLAAWQAGGGVEPAPWRFAAVLLRPPREVLRDAVAARFDAMLRDGAIEEVRALLDRGLDPALPAMRAHGVPELAAHLAGRMALAEARSRAVANTGQYTKRQATWFRHHQLAPPDRDATCRCAIRAIQRNFWKVRP